ncbi:MAG: hypothetical protein KF878_22655 [Planctomycetes bacterium]|nr:hypothetical protein [Planctomycetota bacterium]
MALAAAPLLLLFSLGMRTTGSAEVFRDRIVIRGKGVLPLTVRWDEVVGFRDASDFVQLLRAHRLPDPALTIPTRDDAERAALLDTLMKCGLRRDEGGA